MAITINGTANTVAGVAAGGINDNVVDNGTMADDAIDSAELVAGAVDLAHLSATGTASSSTFLRGDNAWADAGGGKILQVVEATTTTETSSTSTSMADTGLSGSITPASGSKVLVFVNQSFRQYRDRGSTNNMGFGANLLRGSTVLVESKRNDGNSSNDFYFSNTSVNNIVIRHTLQSLDASPGGNGSTAITYKTQFACSHTDDSGQVWAQPSFEAQNQAPTSSIILMEVAA